MNTKEKKMCLIIKKKILESQYISVKFSHTHILSDQNSTSVYLSKTHLDYLVIKGSSNGNEKKKKSPFKKKVHLQQGKKKGK